MKDKASYLRRESIVTIVISILLSGGFHLAVFGWGQAVPVWGIGAYAFDGVIQAFAIGLMAALVPGLLCRKSMIAGKIAGVSNAVPSAGTVVAQAFTSAIATALLGGGALSLLLWLCGVDLIASMPAFSGKVFFGAVLGFIVTRRFLTKMIG